MSDSDSIGPDTTGPGDDLGNDDPITGVTGARTDLDETAPDDEPAEDPLAVRARSMTTATNDAVAGETVLPGAGGGNDGPTGGAPEELQPILPDEQRVAHRIGLDDQAMDPERMDLDDEA